MSGTEEIPEEELKKYPEIDEERESHQPKDTYLLIMDKYLKAIDPNDYYLPSGEAIAKMEALIKDMQEELVKAKELHQKLVDLRGTNKYLETEAAEEGIILRIKNPRSAKAKPRKKRTDIPDISGVVGYGDKLFFKPSKSENVTSYCIINPDEELYTYFNSYDNSINKESISFKKLEQDIEGFIAKLKSKGYKKVVL